MAKNFLKEMFINEAKPALERHSGGKVEGTIIFDDIVDENIETVLPITKKYYKGDLIGNAEIVKGV